MKREVQDNTGDAAWRNALRRDMLARRSALADADHAAFSAAICAHLNNHIAPPPAAVLGACWPIKNEPDIRPMLDSWRKQGCRIALAVVDARNQPLRFREWTPDTQFAPDSFGIPTPQDGEWLVPEILFLPLNGFDAQGYRLGYGGGFFDRTLAALQPRPLAVGIGFEINRVDSIRPLPHDQRLDWVVTERGACKID